MADLFEKCRKYERARKIRESGFYPYFKAFSYNGGNQPLVDGRHVVMVGSNNYLGLTHHPKVKAAALAAVEKYGSSCSGSRFLNGTIDLHVTLEERLARFMRKEAALVYSTGFQTNQGVISSLVGKDDVVFCDRENHASIIDGCRLSFGELKKYRHGDMEDLERLLQLTIERNEASGGFLVVSDGVFSMTGRLPDLPRIVEIAGRYGARVMLDDAHGIGVLGGGGRGAAEHFGVLDQIELVMGTFSKSFASLGGFIAGPADVIDFIRHTSRALIFSASMPPAAVAAVLAALDVIEAEPERRERLWAITRRMKESLDAMGFDTAGSQTPILPIVIGPEEKTMEFWTRLFYEESVFCNAILPPATPPGQSLLRTSYTATHTDAELDHVLEAFERIGRAMGLVR